MENGSAWTCNSQKLHLDEIAWSMHLLGGIGDTKRCHPDSREPATLAIRVLHCAPFEQGNGEARVFQSENVRNPIHTPRDQHRPTPSREVANRESLLDAYPQWSPIGISTA